MDPKLLVGPVMGRTEGQESWVFHPTESCFDVRLAPVGKDNLFAGPFIAVAEKQGFAQEACDPVFPILYS